MERLASFQPGGAPVLLDREGEPFADFAPPERTMVQLEHLPIHVAEAFLAVEDQRFYEHEGVDWRRVGGAALANLRSGSVEQGFSTITMQLARSVFPERLPVERRTMRRKLLEVRVAGEIEDRYSKQEILEMYLNHIYLGNAVHGVGNAARQYFGVDAVDLSLPQAAMLAALAKAPGYFDPRRRPEQARKRRNLVLTIMRRQGRITAGEAEHAQAAPLKVARPARERRTEAGLAPYAVEHIRHILEAELGEQLYTGPLRIFTTIDSRIQRAAEEELRNQLRSIETGVFGAFDGPVYKSSLRPKNGQFEYLQGAIVVMDAQQGNVLAWVGGRDFSQSRFDRAALAQRQVGSAFKPFVYAAALEEGFALSQPIEDAPLSMDMPDGSTWEPHNIDSRSQGPIPLRAALVHSNNLATVRLAQSVGLESVASVARRAGIAIDAELPSIALGAVGMSPQDLTAAYTIFASGGSYVPPRMIERVETAEGEVLWQSRVRPRRVIDDDTAYLVNDVLSEAVQRGTGREALPRSVDIPVAGKTGTTNDVTDAWFVGYTPELVAGVWIGFDQPRPVAAEATAGRLAAPVWARLADRIYAGRRSPARWERPHTVREHWIDPASGLIVRKGCELRGREAQRELFLAGKEPASHCPGREAPPRHAFVVEVPDEVPTDGIVSSLVSAWQRLRDEPAESDEERDQRLAAGDEKAGRTRHDRVDVAAAPQRDASASATPTEAVQTRREQTSASAARGGDPRRERQVRVQVVEKASDRERERIERSRTPVREGAGEPLPERSQTESSPARSEGRINLSGWWGLGTHIEKSSVPDFRGLRLGYRVQLEHNGDRVTGRGQKWSENGRALIGSGRTAIELEGRVRGNEVVLRFREHGARRTSGGTFVLAWSPDGGTLQGTFDSSAATSRGSAQAIRLH